MNVIQDADERMAIALWATENEDREQRLLGFAEVRKRDLFPEYNTSTPYVANSTRVRVVLTAEWKSLSKEKQDVYRSRVRKIRRIDRNL